MILEIKQSTEFTWIADIFYALANADDITFIFLSNGFSTFLVYVKMLLFLFTVRILLEIRTLTVFL